MEECPICYNPTNEWIDSVNSSCSHTLCIECFLKLSRTRDPCCAICRADYRNSVITFGDINSSTPRRLANDDNAFITAVTEAAAAPLDQRPVVIKAKLEEFKKSTELYQKQWLRITSDEGKVRQYLFDKTHSQAVVDEFDSAWICATEIREMNDAQKPVLFNIPETITILCDWYDNARGDDDNEGMLRIDTSLKLLKKKYSSNKMPFEVNLDLNIRYTY